MGELIEYYVILATVEYVNDPLKMGRVKCNIPGIMHTYVTEEDALPWIRPFSMNAYQSFSKPIEGQKVWVLASKTNLNEFWWFPYFETTNLTQDFLDIYYDKHPDVLHARDNKDAMMTYDDRRGYMTQIGDTYLNVQPEGIDLHSNGTHLRISGGHISLGKGPTGKGYDKATNAAKLKDFLSDLGNLFKNLYTAADGHPYTKHLSPFIDPIASKLTGVTDEEIGFENVSGN